MITLERDVKLLIYHQPIDMRKSIDGLVLLVIEALARNPQDRTVYLFRNRSSDKFKAIVWDGDGFLLIYKRREKGRFKFPKHIKQDYYEISADLFIWLRRGFDFYALHDEQSIKKLQYF